MFFSNCRRFSASGGSMILRRYISCLALALASGTHGKAAFAGDIQGKVSVEGIKSPASIVLYLDGVLDRNFDPPQEHAAIHQKRMTFIPHVLAVMKGTTVDFYNEDSVNHGVSWPSVGGNKRLAHHLGIWPQGEMRSFTFNDLGAVPLLCYLHPEMSGYVIVVPTPYFAVTDDDGGYVIKGVPPGEHVLKVWSENGDPVSESVQVTDSATNVNLTVHRTHTRGGE